MKSIDPYLFMNDTEMAFSSWAFSKHTELSVGKMVFEAEIDDDRFGFIVVQAVMRLLG